MYSRFLNKICRAVFLKRQQVVKIHCLLNTQKMKMKGKKSKNHYYFSLLHPVDINLKMWCNLPFLPFKDDILHFGWFRFTPIIPEQFRCPNFFFQFWMSRGVLYSIPKFEQNARGWLTPLVPPYYTNLAHTILLYALN